FKKDLYVGSVQENEDEGTMVQGLHGIYATDLDTDANSVNSYKILPGNGEDKFEAVTEELSGVKFLNIRTKVKLDREESSFYVLTVEASDGGKPTPRAITQIRINIEDTNDCSPQFTSSEYRVSVLSTTPVSTEILKVHAQDQDSEQNSKIYYFFKKFLTKTHNDDSFTLDPHTGIVRVARSLDFTAGNLIQMTIVAQDRGNPTKRTETVVKIELFKGLSQPLEVPTGSQEPRFAKQSYLVRICEDLPVNSHILHPVVVHLARLKPKFTVLSPQEIPFEVDANSGFLYLVKSLDFESRQRYEFKLLLTASETGEANVTVLIDDADENFNAPVFEKGNIAMEFQRNWKLSHFVTKVKATDPDEGLDGQLNYRIDDGDGVRRFYIDERERIFSVPGLNWEGVEQLGLVIEARDNATRWRSGKQFVLISVVGEQDCNPMFERVVYHGNVREHLRSTRTFVAVTKARLCQDRKVQYLITEGNSRNSFEIDQCS
ncbi:protocadherin, partial [Paramuricea clavata]